MTPTTPSSTFRSLPRPSSGWSRTRVAGVAVIRRRAAGTNGESRRESRVDRGYLDRGLQEGATGSAADAARRAGRGDDELVEGQLREAAARSTANGADVTAALEAALRRADAEGLVDVAYATVASPIGKLLVAATEAGLVRLAFPGEDDDTVLTELARRIAPRVVASARRLDPVRRELDEYFEGRRDHFDVALDWRLSAGFRRTVLEHLYADVPYGRTVSYLELATLVGNPKASRAVGTAMATNPIPIVVPCHRVLRTGGHLGGYGGGLDTKVKLLAFESGERPLF